jgi:hypothetical protein
MKKSVLKLFMLYKQFHVIMENVLTIKPENFIHHVFVSQLKWFIFILLFVNILDALADTIKNCIRQLHDLSNYTARYYCGFTLMKYCAVHLGLDGYPLKFDAWNESMVFQKIWMKVFYFLFIIYFVLTLWWWIEKEKKYRYLTLPYLVLIISFHFSIFHINKDILRRCHPFFNSDNWRVPFPSVMQSEWYSIFKQRNNS